MKETLQIAIENQLKIAKNSAEQQPQVNCEEISPESPTSTQSQISDELAYDTGVSSSSSVNGDNKVECVVENNAENKPIEEDKSKKDDIKKTKVNSIIF